MELNLELGALVLGVVVVKRVIDDDHVIAAAHTVRVASNGDADRVGIVENIIANGHIAAVVTFVFARRFHVQIAVVDGVAFENDILATVTVEPVGVVGIALARIVDSADVVDRVAADLSILGLIVSGGPNSLKPDGVNADVVVVVHDVVGNREVSHVPVHVHGFALSGFQVVNLIAADRELGDRCARCPVHGDAKGVSVLLGSCRDVVHEIVEQANAGA